MKEVTIQWSIRLNVGCKVTATVDPETGEVDVTHIDVGQPESINPNYMADHMPQADMEAMGDAITKAAGEAP